MKKLLSKFLLLFFAMMLLASVHCVAGGLSDATPTLVDFPEISAKSYILADAKTGEVLFASNENSRMPIASTTKILTCLVALENADLDDIVTVTADSCGIEGSSVYLYEGEKISVEDLLYALMLESANDAAVCIATHVSGSVQEFSKLMNEKAGELGLVDSHFNNPHGLEDPEHYSTAHDLSRIWCEAMNNTDFRRIVASKTHKIALDNDDGYRFLSNHNRLLKTFNSCIGGKTGYTKNAGRCLVTGAEMNGIELVMVTLNAPNDWDDHESLMNYAFSLYSSVDVAKPGSVTINIPVVGGSKKSISAVNKEGLTLSLKDMTKLEVKVASPRFVYAPVSDKTTPIATVIYTIEGKEIATLPLYPKETVTMVEKQSIFKRFISLFK